MPLWLKVIVLAFRRRRGTGFPLFDAWWVEMEERDRYERERERLAA